MNGYDKFVSSEGKIIEISQMCYQTNPCKHHTIQNGDYKLHVDGLALYTYLFENGFDVGHFEYLEPVYKKLKDTLASS